MSVFAPPAMAAITLHQPWAWAFCHGKLLENRDWKPKLKRGQPVAIHASVTEKELADLWQETGPYDWPVGHREPPAPEAFVRVVNKTGRRVRCDPPDPATILGGVVAVAIFDRVVTGRLPATSSQEVWRAPGSRFGWLFARSDPLPAPVPCTGSQKLWHLRPETNERVIELWSRSLM